MRPPAVLVSMSIIYTHIVECMNLMKQVVQEIRSIPQDFQDKLDATINSSINYSWGLIDAPVDSTAYVEARAELIQRVSQEFDDPDWQYIPVDVRGYATDAAGVALDSVYDVYNIDKLLGNNKAANLIVNAAVIAVTADLRKTFNSLTLVPLSVIEDILIAEVNAVADALSKLTP